LKNVGGGTAQEPTIQSKEIGIVTDASSFCQ